jgi:hypothetical protein
LSICRFALPTLALLVAASWSCTEEKKNEIPADVKTALDKAETFELYSLDPGPGEKEDVKNGFHAWHVLGKTTIKKADTRKEVIAALAKGVEANKGEAAKCFDPRHGIRVVHDGKTIDLVICFRCLQVQVFHGDKRSDDFLTTASPQETFDKVLKTAGVPLAPKSSDK